MDKKIRKKSHKGNRSKEIKNSSNSEEPLFLLITNDEGTCSNLISSGTFSCTCNDDDTFEFYGLEYDDHSIQFHALDRSGNNSFTDKSYLICEDP